MMGGAVVIIYVPINLMSTKKAFVWNSVNGIWISRVSICKDINNWIIYFV